MNSPPDNLPQDIYTVSRLNREVRFLLETHFATLLVEGEISNFVAPHSGHWYFSIKDAQAQTRCAMFKMQNARLNFTPQNGMHVTLRARISLYEGRGDYQLLVEHIEEAGIGKLRQQFEILKQRLAQAGMFALENKKPLPSRPKVIGVITSRTGAAIRDVLSVLQRRYPQAPVIIYHTLVQGDLAAANIVQALTRANEGRECDVLILTRGGGSIEDLWPFNDERVAQAIFASHIPIISGVGHEIDFTIADFVADHRAPTPSAAAELATPDMAELVLGLAQKEQRLQRLMTQKLQHYGDKLTWVDKHLQQQHPKRRLQEQMQKLDVVEATLQRQQSKIIHLLQTKLASLEMRFMNASPSFRIKNFHNQLDLQILHLRNFMQRLLQQRQQKFSFVTSKLDTLSPLATLNRGYAIAFDQEKKIVRDVSMVKIDDCLEVKVSDGMLKCRVEDIVSNS